MSLVTWSLFACLILQTLNAETIKCSGPCSCDERTSGETCRLDCLEKDHCKDSTLRCRSKDPCVIMCYGDNACAGNTDILAEDSTNVNLICIGEDSCKGNTKLHCGTGKCIISCQHDTSCQDLSVTGTNVPSFSYQCTPDSNCRNAHYNTPSDSHKPDNEPLPPHTTKERLPPHTTKDHSYPPYNPKQPTPKIYRKPLPEPTQSLTNHPTIEPTSEPTMEPTMEPTLEPTLEPITTVNTPIPTPNPTPYPTTFPISNPTQFPINPTPPPSDFPTVFPTVIPTVIPTVHPTVNPTRDPISSVKESPPINSVNNGVNSNNYNGVRVFPSLAPTLKPSTNPVELEVVISDKSTEIPTLATESAESEEISQEMPKDGAFDESAELSTVIPTLATESKESEEISQDMPKDDQSEFDTPQYSDIEDTTVGDSDSEQNNGVFNLGHNIKRSGIIGAIVVIVCTCLIVFVILIMLSQKEAARMFDENKMTRESSMHSVETI